MNTRKKRSDRNHIIYKITCLKTKETYICLTVQKGQKKIGSAKIRLRSHVSRAKNGGGWLLHEKIRELGENYFVTEVNPVDELPSATASMEFAYTRRPNKHELTHVINGRGITWNSGVLESPGELASKFKNLYNLIFEKIIDNIS